MDARRWRVGGDIRPNNVTDVGPRWSNCAGRAWVRLAMRQCDKLCAQQFKADLAANLGTCQPRTSCASLSTRRRAASRISADGLRGRHAAPDDQIKSPWGTPAFLHAGTLPHCCLVKGPLMATAVQDWEGQRDLRQPIVKKVRHFRSSSPRLMVLSLSVRATG